ncbi:hypothetical protein [Streptomyces sp. CC53]|uniref:hypothetical protein n=1 Tax=Streptomyces sp. CC53 TaxID=1906740 RepID=UPI0015A6E2AD|nr:hypothetical protein [Streptomyces sp. CC53]
MIPTHVYRQKPVRGRIPDHANAADAERQDRQRRARQRQRREQIQAERTATRNDQEE